MITIEHDAFYAFAKNDNEPGSFIANDKNIFIEPGKLVYLPAGTKIRWLPSIDSQMLSDMEKALEYKDS